MSISKPRPIVLLSAADAEETIQKVEAALKQMREYGPSGADALGLPRDNVTDLWARLSAW
jgi:hypothetical protein